MELKELLAIFRRHEHLFFSVVLGALFLGALFYFFQPAKFKAELVLNVTRTGQEKTADYQFDDFYRLQADERFADTIVRWLETKQMQSEIQKEAGLGSGSFALSAKRLSSQMIKVEISAPNPQVAEEAALAAVGAVNQEAEKLNEWQKKENWFKVLADDPAVNQDDLGWDKILLISLVLGIFVAFWAVLIRHYLK